MIHVAGLSVSEKRSARCLMPRSILLCMTGEPGSIGTMPRRAARFGSRKRLRLINRLPRLAAATQRSRPSFRPPDARRARARTRLDPSSSSWGRGWTSHRPADAGTPEGRGRCCACRAPADSRSSHTSVTPQLRIALRSTNLYSAARAPAIATASVRALTCATDAGRRAWRSMLPGARARRHVLPVGATCRRRLASSQ